jgi:hypothetical protein
MALVESEGSKVVDMMACLERLVMDCLFKCVVLR